MIALRTSMNPGRSYAAALALFAACAGSGGAAADDYAQLVRGVQPKIVKIHGAGGYRGLEAYQSGFLFSADGYLLTVWSYVLDTDYISVTLDDGRKFDAELVAADPRLEAAVLKIDAAELPCFDLAAAAQAAAGTRVLAFSNLFGVAVGDEDASVQHGVVSVVTKLNARRGVFETPYDGDALILDAMTNNPGSAGGALVDGSGRLLGMLGKELRHAENGLWLNFAIPTAELRPVAEAMRGGTYVRRPSDPARAKPDRPTSLAALGLVLVPDVLERTPPFVDAVRPGGSAAAAGVRPDDLLLFVNDRITQSCQAVRTELEFLNIVDPVRITLLRGRQLVEVVLKADWSARSLLKNEATP